MADFEQARKTLHDSFKRSKMVKNQRALEAFLKVKREEFLPEKARNVAYMDRPVRLFDSQTMSAPHMTVLILDYLSLSLPSLRILEIGAGSGYQAALLSHMVPDGHVFTIERIESLYNFGKANLERAGYDNVSVFLGDGTLGLPDHAPFDRIILTAAGDQIPPPLIDQLAPDGLLIMPLGEGQFSQTMIEIRKTKDGEIIRRNLSSVAFVPLIGEYGVRSR